MFTYRLNLSNVLESRLSAGRVVVYVTSDLSILCQATDDRLPFPALVERCTQFIQIDLRLLALRVGEAAGIGHALRVGGHIHRHIRVGNGLPDFLL